MQQPNMMQPQYSQPPQPQYNQQPQPQYQTGPPHLAAMWSQQPSQVPPRLAQQPMPTMYQAQPQQYQATGGSGGSDDEIKSIWIGDLQNWMDEVYVSNCFAQTGQIVSVKLIRNKQSGQLEGYGFIEFTTRAAAEQALQMYNGARMPNSNQNFRLNWASFGAGERRREDGVDCTLFVGDLAPDVTDYIKSIWIGDLQYWMDENYVSNCFAQTGQIVSVKLIRNKQSGKLEGYGFIEFTTHAAAEQALQMYNGARMPNSNQNFRLNWASFGAGEKRREDGADCTLFVGDLAPDVTDYILQETFKSHYPSVKGANVVMDKLTGRPKGYGFVKFGDANEQTRALTEMQGMYCSSRPMRIGVAANQNKVDAGGQQYSTASYKTTEGTQSEGDPNSTTIFVGGLDDTNVPEEELYRLFSTYGELVHVKIAVGKRCGFVQFANRACAEEALLMLNGTLVGSQNIRLSWGRNASNRQTQQQDPSQYNNSNNGYGQQQGYNAYGNASNRQTQQQDPSQYNNSNNGYGQQQGYNAYGNGQQAKNPNMYAYGAYPNYQQQASYPQQQ